MHTFSAHSRHTTFATLHTEAFDLLVIGGGITGAGIALDAAARGLRVVLLEKHDFAWGTSSRSTKLIHGGLRYLKQLEIGLVREVGIERAIVHRNARHLVVPERMLLPIVQGGSLGKFTTSLALWVYDWLAGVPKNERRRMIDAAATARAEPLLRTDIVLGGGIYYEYRTDDARLTTEILKTAALNGAICLNYAEVTGFIYDAHGAITGAEIVDGLTQKTQTVTAKKIVNAAGPWVDNLRRLDDTAPLRKQLHLTKGVHIVVPFIRLPLQQSVYFDVPNDGRMIFAIPRGNTVYIGTTDTTYGEAIEQPKITAADTAYLLAAANALFPVVALTAQDIVGTWAGLRPLIHEVGKSPSELSRRDEIFYSKSGLISIAGGKLTGYRKMAERVVNEVVKQLRPNTYKPCSTKTLVLHGANFAKQSDIAAFKQRRIGEAKQAEISPIQVAEWINRYGKNADIIIEKTYELFPTIANAHERCVVAELWYGIEYEMVCTVADFLIRRTGQLYFAEAQVLAHYPRYAELMGELLNWSEARVLREKAEMQKELKMYL
jgi:glycerol-3-phosphate dehydrogenase